MRWVRFLGVDEVPQQLDPPDGIVVTANNRIVGDDFAAYIAADYMSGYRARRLRELLVGDAMDAERMRIIQLDLRSPPATEVSGMLGGVTCSGAAAEAMRQRLVAWNGEMAPGLVEPTVYEAFMVRLAEHALRPLCGDAWGIAAGVELHHPLFEYPGNLIGRTTPLLVEAWAAGDESLFDGQTTWPEVASRALEDAVADLGRTLGAQRRWRWGRAHAIVLRHPLAVRPLLGRILNAPPIRVGGGVDTVMATASRPGLDFTTRVMAPSWRHVFDVGAWDSGCTGILYPGQSGHRASRHHHDLSKRWLRNHQLPLAWGDRAFSGRRRLTLIPGQRGLITTDTPV
jgi:penicillin amidase